MRGGIMQICNSSSGWIAAELWQSEAWSLQLSGDLATAALACCMLRPQILATRPLGHIPGTFLPPASAYYRSVLVPLAGSQP